MKCKVVGHENIKFKDKITNEPIEFNKIYVEFPNTKKNAIGNKTAEINTIISVEKIEIGKEYNFIYDGHSLFTDFNIAGVLTRVCAVVRKRL
jgi:hypothetical protein